MKTVIIQSKNKRETDLILQVARKMKMRGRYLSDEKLEDQWLARMIKEAEEAVSYTHLTLPTNREV